MSIAVLIVALLSLAGVIFNAVYSIRQSKKNEIIVFILKKLIGVYEEVVIIVNADIKTADDLGIYKGWSQSLREQLRMPVTVDNYFSDVLNEYNKIAPFLGNITELKKIKKEIGVLDTRLFLVNTGEKKHNEEAIDLLRTKVENNPGLGFDIKAMESCPEGVAIFFKYNGKHQFIEKFKEQLERQIKKYSR